MLLPLTPDGRPGTVFRIDRLRQPGGYSAKVVSGVQIYPCTGARTPQAARLLARALGEGGQRFVRSLRVDRHDPDPTCWLHGDAYCLSTRS
jgi:protein-L-isoaspartate(D-aspartate) O-methyltransferase